MKSNTKKTVLRTIRITEDLDTLLNKDARTKRVNVNTLISSILTKYSEWDRYSERFGVVSLRQDIIKMLIESIEDDKLVQVAKQIGRRVPRELILFLFKKITVEIYLEYLSRLCRYGGYGHYELETDGKDYVITILHNMGIKWSIYLSNAIETGLWATLGAFPKFETTETSIVIRFQLP